jgi:predicted RNA-binding protein YlxR (DUF448 family)
METLRTCVGCRQVKPRAALVRVVRGGDGIVRVDVPGTAPGRGAYLCADPSCVERAIKGARFGHAFRKPCNAGSTLAEEVRGLWQQRRSR